MSPLADAVGLVDGDERDVRRFQEVNCLFLDQSFRSDVQQADRSVPDGERNCLLFRERLRAVDKRGLDAALMQCVHLILHQGD